MPAIHPSPRRLRVFRVYSRMEVGGIEKRILDLLPRMDTRRFEMGLILIKRGGPLADEVRELGLPVHLLRCHGHHPRWNSTRRLTRFLARLAPDILHSHTIEPSLYATLAGRRAGIPVVIANYHNMDSIPLPKQIRMERRQSAMRDATIHVSRKVHEDYLHRVEPLLDNGVVIYNGVDIERFRRTPRRSEASERLRRKWGLDSASAIVLCVARLHRNKDHGLLIRALKSIRPRFPDLRLLLAGSGPEEANLREHLVSTGDDAWVTLLGDRRDMAEIYALADLHVLASIKEGFSNVVLEAMAAGLPQVLSDVGGNREAIGESGAAEIIPTRESRVLAAAVEDLLSQPEKRRRMSEAALGRVKKFTVDAQVRALESLYLECAAHRKLI